MYVGELAGGGETFADFVFSLIFVCQEYILELAVFDV